MDFQFRQYKNGTENAINLGFRQKQEHPKASSGPNFSIVQDHGEKMQDEQPKWIVRFLDATITASLILIFFGIPIFFTGFSLQGIVFEKQLYFYFLILLALVAWVSKGVIVG